MIIDTTKLKAAIKTYEERKRELIGDDQEALHELRREIEELQHDLRLAELTADRFKNV